MTARYFHYLAAENNNEEAHFDKEWQGRLGTVEKIVKKEALNTKQSLTGQLSVHSEKMKELMALCSETASLVQRMAHQLDEMESWKRSTEERMDKIDSSINQLLQKQEASS